MTTPLQQVFLAGRSHKEVMSRHKREELVLSRTFFKQFRESIVCFLYVSQCVCNVILFLLKPQSLPLFIGILGFDFAAISTTRNKICKCRCLEYMFN
jgi:hypothetical protein